jgi:hypoxanthine phosphoribosyltransferase
MQNGCKNVDICVLLNKKEAHDAKFEPKFYAFEIGNEFVIGYGLDYNGKYRTLPYIATL